MLPNPLNDAERLLRFNAELLTQALALVAAHQAGHQTANAPRYAGTVGAHLRHVIEHHEALVFAARSGTVDYDGRARDRELENQPALAHARLWALQARLAAWPGAALDTPLRVLGLAGVRGEFAFAVGSTLGRELAFVASHAVHHFALLHAHCAQHGIPLPAGFGLAPATQAHARATTLSNKENVCPALQAAA